MCCGITTEQISIYGHVLAVPRDEMLNHNLQNWKVESISSLSDVQRCFSSSLDWIWQEFDFSTDWLKLIDRWFFQTRAILQVWLHRWFCNKLSGVTGYHIMPTKCPFTATNPPHSPTVRIEGSVFFPLICYIGLIVHSQQCIFVLQQRISS